jgi:hypothetical protein
MHWELVVSGQVVLCLRVDHEFLDWLRPRVSDYEVAQLDPFRDTVLEERLQDRWFTALRQVHEALRSETRASVEKRRLPVDPQAREFVARQLVERELARHPWARFLDELIALFELAKGSNAIIRAFGD